MNINDIKICETIRELRRKRGMTQEILSEALGVSVQAVSKWETLNSLPDVCMVPQIASVFGITLDDLFFGIRDEPVIKPPFPDDGKLRIVQYHGSNLLSVHDYNRNVQIPLKFPESSETGTICVEVWGGANIEGDINGDLSAGNGVNCGGIKGNVTAGNGVNCGAVGGGINAGNGVNCGAVSGDVSAGTGIKCGDIVGDIISCGGDVRCTSVKGNVSCGGDIVYKN